MEQNILKVGKGSYVTDISFNASFPTFARLLDIFSLYRKYEYKSIKDHFPKSLRVSDPDPVFLSGSRSKKKEFRKGSKSYLSEENLKIMTKNRHK